MSDNDVKDGLGCIFFVIAAFLAVLLWNITPELIDYLERVLSE